MYYHNVSPMKAEIAGEQTDHESPFLQCAAKHAFWQMTKTQLLRIADNQGVAIGDSSCLFSVLFPLVKHCLAVQDPTDEDMHAILSKRVDIPEPETAHGLDRFSNALDLLDSRDVKTAPSRTIITSSAWR